MDKKEQKWEIFEQTGLVKDYLKYCKIDEPSDYDNHDLHIQQHIAFLLDEEFDKMKDKSKYEKIMTEHINKHKQFLKSE